MGFWILATLYVEVLKHFDVYCSEFTLKMAVAMFVKTVGRLQN
jgi:hypothetical protein